MSIHSSVFSIKAFLDAHTRRLDALPARYVGIGIACAAGFGLFMELFVIRAHSSFFHLFAYFKNVSLLSCFLGLGVGYTLGKRGPLFTPFIIPLFAIQIVLFIFLSRASFSSLLQNPVTESLTHGMGHAEWWLPILVTYSFLLLVFTYNALCFVPLGQLAARLMLRQRSLVAYGWNLLGSIAGIATFAALSALWTPLWVWFLFGSVIAVSFIGLCRSHLLPTLLACASVLIVSVGPLSPSVRDIYSPYQKLSLGHEGSIPAVHTNNVYFQRFLDLRDEATSGDVRAQAWAWHYALPYVLAPTSEEVLIVGSGTGNDVAAALRYHAKRVDAVEIDPAIVHLGRTLHPEKPYQSDNVHVHLNDARAYIRATDRTYDLIIYGLLDSHTLLSGNSGGVRLDSYLYTVEAFREARERLNEGGMISLAFSVIKPELGRKLFLMLEEAFDGKPPVVIYTGYDIGYVFLAGAVPEPATWQRFDGETRDVTSMFSQSDIIVDASRDDWPFFYMPLRQYPFSYVFIIIVLLAVSVWFVRTFTHFLRPVPHTGFDRMPHPRGDQEDLPQHAEGTFVPTRPFAFHGRAYITSPVFFLGAGFMLIETKGISELALVYGSTWVVTGVVILCILLLGYAANAVVLRAPQLNTTTVYILTISALAVGLLFSHFAYQSLSLRAVQIIAPLALTLPVFFSGMAFSLELKRFTYVSTALAVNILGAMAGGFLEYNAMYFGFRFLYYVAIVLYGCAFIVSRFHKATV